MVDLVWITLALPLLGVVLLSIGGTRISPRAAGLIGTLVMLAAFGTAFVATIMLMGRPEDDRAVTDTLWTWMASGSLDIGMTLWFDQLTAVMLLIVTGVGMLIHVYSIGYMQGDPQTRRFFAYLNLFAFSMLLLVIGGNLVLLLAGWGMVGLSSYLLIGFWHERRSAVAAAKKAFIVNAIGDVGLALGIFLLFVELGTVSYAGIFAGRGELDETTATIACFLLLVGAVAKSAQLPLQTWLPDAMEGPTPVSALIHAATMVTAGVYLIARMNPLFAEAPIALDAVVIIGAVGLLMAGAIAVVQTDIKRIIAFSTMSQIAYMFVGVGLAAYWTGIFHLITHAFFKALLFMGAGLVIHVLYDEQDVRNMGGLRKWMPKTYFMMLIGALALVGIFPLSGGVSKDAILASALHVHTPIAWFAYAAGILGALLTGLYTFRLIFLVFHRPPSPYAANVAPKSVAHHGEGPRSMLWPVYILTVLAAIAGILEFPGITSFLYDWLSPIAPDGMVKPTVAEDYLTTLIAVTAGLIGIGIAAHLYLNPSDAAERIRTGRGRLIAHALEHRLYFDDLYDVVFCRPAQWLATFLRRGLDRPAFVWPIDGVAQITGFAGRSIAVIQNGIVRAYVLVFALGLGLLLLYFLVRGA
jgi:NADH-quinone oxidoreductase subunit L